ncbi:MAG: TIM barrel protein [Halobacteriales archaeon]
MFDVHVTNWAVFDADPVETARLTAEAGADGIEYLDPRADDFAAVAETADEHGVGLVSTGAGGVAANTGTAGPAMTDPDLTGEAVADIEEALDLAGDVVENMVITVGPDQEGIERAVQRNAIVRALREAAPAAAEHGVTLQVEPLNTRVDHPGYFLTTVDEGVGIVEAVDHPNVRLLFDVYHQQVTEGDLISRIRSFSEYVGMYHVADVPGRGELGTGEVNWENVFAAIADTGFEGTLGLEYVPQGDPGESVQEAVAIRDRACGRA